MKPDSNLNIPNLKLPVLLISTFLSFYFLQIKPVLAEFNLDPEIQRLQIPDKADDLNQILSKAMRISEGNLITSFARNEIDKGAKSVLCFRINDKWYYILNLDGKEVNLISSFFKSYYFKR